MQLRSKVGASLTGFCLVLAGMVSCTSGPDQTQQLIAADHALGFRYAVPGPDMINHLVPVGTVQPRMTEIPADSAERITLISASLIALPGFRTPQLVTTGVVAGNCRLGYVLQPAAPGHLINVSIGGIPVQPLPLRGYSMEIGAGCVPQIVYVVRAESTGQYAAGGLSVLVRYDGRTMTLYANSGLDIWYYDSRWLPTAHQVADGLRSTFAAQVVVYHQEGG